MIEKILHFKLSRISFSANFWREKISINLWDAFHFHFMLIINPTSRTLWFYLLFTNLRSIIESLKEINFTFLNTKLILLNLFGGDFFSIEIKLNLENDQEIELNHDIENQLPFLCFNQK